jgi:hypothetical protein
MMWVEGAKGTCVSLWVCVRECSSMLKNLQFHTSCKKGVTTSSSPISCLTLESDQSDVLIF